MKRAFTLIELMVVVGIMSFLGVAATGGYAALQRGMAERGAVAAASSLLKAAKERAQVDRSPTVVFCYNRMLRDNSSDTENAVIVGEMVAVRRAGRITYVGGKNLADEFMDAVGCYDIVDSGKVNNRPGMRLWRFDDTDMNQMQYSIVADALIPLRGDTQLYTYGGWADGNAAGCSNMATHIVYSFYDLNKSSHTPSGGWKVGNGYGFEFARIQLPKDFIFGTAVPAGLQDVKQVKAVYFDPESDKNDSVEVYFCMPGSSGIPQPHHKAGAATSKENQKI